jgi:hypothetical protein
VALGSAVAAATTLVGIGAAARPVIHEHESFNDTFADSICGIPGTSVGPEGSTTSPSTRTTRSRTTSSSGRRSSAAGSGKSIVCPRRAARDRNDEPIDNGDGTLTFVNTFKGLPEQIKLPNGRCSHATRVRDVTLLIDAATDELISQTVSSEKGPHPELDSDFEIFCNVVARRSRSDPGQKR